MASLKEMKVPVTQYKIFFFPFVSLTICGEIKILKVFGFKVYQKAGSAQKLFWVTWCPHSG